MDREEIVNRLLRLTDILATEAKEVSDTKNDLEMAKFELECKKSDLLLSGSNGSLRNEDQRKAITTIGSKEEKAKIIKLQKKLDYARLKWYRHKEEFDTLLGALWSYVPELPNTFLSRSEAL